MLLHHAALWSALFRALLCCMTCVILWSQATHFQAIDTRQFVVLLLWKLLATQGRVHSYTYICAYTILMILQPLQADGSPTLLGLFL